ncbi:MAG: glyoxalase [Candidatus Marinimicrobia bacterium]|nr:glyoxalase [Candidatus Neomarinimicrobiota bacterium]|tara:strand:+ start:569 stop:1060 length:492 start_codon:yes stop_codon:yes gene_type:complete
MLNRLHHFAWKCRSIEETKNFYSNILKLPLVKTIKKTHVPSTGLYEPYEHIFFELPDKSNIAFFKTDNQLIETNVDDWIIHFAFNVNTKEEVNYWKSRLIQNKINVIGPTNHDNWIYSIYFFDPNKLRLEITTDISKKYQDKSLQQLDNIKNANIENYPRGAS